MTKQATSTSAPEITSLILSIQAPYNKIRPLESYFEEFESLIKTLELKFTHKLTIKLRTLDKAHFFTKGKLQSLKEYCDQNNIDEIIISEILSPLQERNLEEILDCKVWDREKLILEIFKHPAHSAEGKIQVEMAEIEL